MNLYIANPRGFCAGVDRAIQIVEMALAKYGAPVYVRHEIVHNKYVVEGLSQRGAIFVDELDEVLHPTFKVINILGWVIDVCPHYQVFVYQ